MSHGSYIEALLEADDPVAAEYPAGFRRSAALAEVRALKEPIETLLGRTLELDDSVEDASYFASLVWYYEVPPDPDLYTAPGVVRGSTFYRAFAIDFSCFGRFVSIDSSEKPEDAALAERRSSIEELLVERGFVPLPEEALDAPYSGHNPHFAGQSWGQRYFSHI